MDHIFKVIIKLLALSKMGLGASSSVSYSTQSRVSMETYGSLYIQKNSVSTRVFGSIRGVFRTLKTIDDETFGENN